LSKRRKTKPKRVAVSVVLPQDVLDSLEIVENEVEETRSSVIETFLRYCLEEEHLNEIYPYEDE
jgi:metal-responsive CopG/Arc/MetJ family transcriptional regulator